jgi:type IV pilus assembly protein PilN
MNPGPELDLLRERREELGISALPATDTRALLMRGLGIGGAILGLVLLGCLGLRWRQQLLATERERLAPVQAQSELLQKQLSAERSERSALETSNRSLAEALVAVRSGSALLQGLVAVTPAGVQLSDAKVEGEALSLKGLSSDPQAFRRINALVLELQGLPLFDPAQVLLKKASRQERADAAAGAGPPRVEFELSAGFRPRQSAADLKALQQLGAEGMARRLLYLQKEGLLR